jgi:hypothetical protein
VKLTQVAQISIGREDGTSNSLGECVDRSRRRVQIRRVLEGRP